MNKKDVCKYGHPIKREQIVLLNHAVGVCDKCGHRYLHSEIPGTYIYDLHNDLNERFHVYAFSSLLFCGGCKSIMVSIKMACKDPVEYEVDWAKELTNNINEMIKKEKR
jgi:hypothetical protein